MTAPHAGRLLNVKQLADQLSLSERSVRRLLPEIGFVRVGRAIRIPQSYLEIYLQRRSIPPLEKHSCRRAEADGGIAFLADRIIGKNRRGEFRK